MCPLLVLGEECGPCVVARHAGSLSVQLLLGIVLRRRGRRKLARPSYLYIAINRINLTVNQLHMIAHDNSVPGSGLGDTSKGHASHVWIGTRARCLVHFSPSCSPRLGEIVQGQGPPDRGLGRPLVSEA